LTNEYTQPTKKGFARLQKQLSKASFILYILKIMVLQKNKSHDIIVAVGDTWLTQCFSIEV